MLGPCGAFGAAVLGLMDDGEDFTVLTADLRFYSGLDRCANAYPENVLNVGIAEQNMVGIASGMAKEGMRVFATTYATFASTRCLDQVRVGMGYMQLPVVLVGLTSGLSVGVLGPTHMSCEDIAIMRAIPNITVVSPCDCLEVVKATEACLKAHRPLYLRLPGGTNNEMVNRDDYSFEIGKAITLREGQDIALVATGAMVSKALAASALIEEELNVGVKVLNMHTIKPLDSASIELLLAEGHKLVATVEEHSCIGGLGDAVMEVVATSRSTSSKIAFVKIGIEDIFPHAAPYTQLLETCGLTPEGIGKRICHEWKQIVARNRGALSDDSL
jgi:transketolase